LGQPIKIESDEWFSEIFSRSVYKVSMESTQLNLEEHSDVQCLQDHANQEQGAFYYTKIPTCHLEAVWLLEKVEFHVVDVNVTLCQDSSDRPSQLMDLSSTCQVVLRNELNDSQMEDVLDIASNSFVYSRFHLDPACPNEVADRIKHDWVENYILGNRGEELLVALKDGKPVGFIAVYRGKTNQLERCVIELMAIHEEHQRKGIGKRLGQRFLEEFNNWADEFQVGTQVANVPSVNFYYQMGFELSEAKYVLHRYIPDPVIGEKS